MTPLSAWFSHVEWRRDPHVRLQDLGAQARLEIQYGLQRRYELGSQHTAPRVVTKVVGWVRESGVHSLLDWDDAAWKDFCRPKPGNYDTLSLAFITDTRFQLHALLIAADPLGRPVSTGRLGSQACRPEHTQCAASAVRRHRAALVEGAGQALVPVATGPRPESRHGRDRRARLYPTGRVSGAGGWCTGYARGADPSAHRVLAGGAADGGAESVTRSTMVHSVSGFLKDVHRHEWQPDLPNSAVIYNDAPQRLWAKPRFIPEHIMRSSRLRKRWSSSPHPTGG